MVNARLALLAAITACAIQAQENAVHIEISATGYSFFLTSDKQVEVIQLEVNGATPYVHWGVDLERPALLAGQRTMFHATYPAEQVTVLSVSYSDGTFAGPGALAVQIARDQIRAGGPVDALPTSEWNAPIKHLLMQHQRRYPGTQIQVRRE